MNIASTLSSDQPSRIDNDIKGNTKNYVGNQARAPSYRSFGRELSNFEAQSESTNDPSKGNVQGALNHKENFFTIGRSSFSNESELEKGLNNLHIDPAKNIQARNKQNLDEENDRDETDSVDFQKRNDPQYVVSYVKEIFTHLRETEERYIAQAGYMARVQSDVNDKMRAILVDWLVDVHIKFKLLPETLFLSVNLIDRFLEQTCVSRQKLQLVGVAAMLIASKYEDIYPPEIKEFEYVTDRAYTKQEILDMEGKMISCLRFNLTTTSSLRFLERYALVAKLDEKMLNMAKYLLELALVDYKMLKYTPSTIACSAIYLINKIHKREGWPIYMAKEAKYLEGQLRPCAKDLCILLQGAAKSTHQAVRRKFSSSKYMQVAKIQLDKA